MTIQIEVMDGENRLFVVEILDNSDFNSYFIDSCKFQCIISAANGSAHYPLFTMQFYEYNHACKKWQEELS